MSHKVLKNPLFSLWGCLELSPSRWILGAKTESTVTNQTKSKLKYQVMQAFSLTVHFFTVIHEFGFQKAKIDFNLDYCSNLKLIVFM